MLTSRMLLRAFLSGSDGAKSTPRTMAWWLSTRSINRSGMSSSPSVAFTTRNPRALAFVLARQLHKMKARREDGGDDDDEGRVDPSLGFHIAKNNNAPVAKEDAKPAAKLTSTASKSSTLLRTHLSSTDQGFPTPAGSRREAGTGATRDVSPEKTSQSVLSDMDADQSRAMNEDDENNSLGKGPNFEDNTKVAAVAMAKSGRGEAEDRARTSPPPPVKEIHTTPQKMNNRLPKEKKRRSGDRWSKNLDETTLLQAKANLSNFKGDVLDEEEVMMFAIRMNRIANSQARHHTSLITGVKPNDTSDLSEAGSDDTSIYQECLREEEFHAVGHDLYKSAVASMQPHPASKEAKELAAAAAAAKNASATNKTGSVSNSKANKFDQKTLLWIKRAAGLHRSTSVLEKSGRMTTRVFTRKQAQDSRVQKRDRGLDFLVEAVKQLEPEFGPFPVREPTVRKTKRTKKKSRRAQEADLDEMSKEQERLKRKKDKEVGEDPVRKRAKLEAKENKRKEKESKKLMRRKKKRKSLPRKKEAPPVKKICTSLRQLDWLWRDRVKDYHAKGTGPRTETEDAYQLRKHIPLHPQFVQAGIVHALPTMRSLAAGQATKDIPGRVFDAPRVRHSDGKYAEFCDRLMKCVTGRGRLFATCEFFYSDLDREWYNHNAFAADAAKLGVPVDTKLSRCEWRVVRRLLRKRPRRFSKKFIISQLSERNEYRCTVRKLQANPHLSATEHFPHTVHAPIRVGTTVTAYNKRFRIVQRGRILTYDRSTALYLVEFENKQFGYELCPDSEVATCGIPVVLIPASSNANRLADQQAVPLPGSCAGPAPGMVYLPEVNAVDGLGEKISFSGVEKSVPAGRPPKRGRPFKKQNEPKPVTVPVEETTLLEDVANHEAFVVLLEVIDTARNRKRGLLASLEDFKTLMVGDLPFGDHDSSGGALSTEALDHIRWLEDNLERTNLVLGTSMEYLRTLYGAAYLPAHRTSDAPVDRFLEHLHASVHDGQPSTLSRDWTESLVASSQDISQTIVSKMHKKGLVPVTDKKGLVAVVTGMPAANVGMAGIGDGIGVGRTSTTILDQIAAAGQVAYSASYIKHVGRDAVGTECYLALETAAEKLMSRNFPQEETAHHLYNEVACSRQGAVKDLKEALATLKSELILSDLKRVAA